jgi:hypothetical protein
MVFLIPQTMRHSGGAGERGMGLMTQVALAPEWKKAFEPADRFWA